MKRFLIVDDHPSVRNGIKQIINYEFSDAEFGEAASGSEALKKIDSGSWDMMIIDMDMPGRNGLDVLEQLKRDGSKIPVLMFSMHAEKQIAIRALKLGAFGYLSKTTADDELANAIRTISSGRKYITPSLAELLAEQLDDTANKAPHELLSNREYQTLLLFAKGKTASQIADELSLSVHTISTYRSRILEKTGMKTNAEFVNYAIRNNLT